jgi:hypothetical protein
MAAAISGTRRAIKELVDGTVRVQIDIDPDCRRDFFRLFPEIDTRIALAPLKNAAKPDTKGGELARLAGVLCSDSDFQFWIEHNTPGKEMPVLGAEDDDPAERAAIIVRHRCGVKSRAELDHNGLAAERFHELIRKPWMESR